jgi:hypothetical protein
MEATVEISGLLERFDATVALDRGLLIEREQETSDLRAGTAATAQQRDSDRPPQVAGRGAGADGCPLATALQGGHHD